MARFGIPATNALYDEFEGASMRLSFQYATFHEDYSGFTNAPHYRSHKERIGGKTARMAEFYYELADPPAYHELIAVDFPGVDGDNYRLHLTAFCRTTNEYDTARTIFRTVRFKQ